MGEVIVSWSGGKDSCLAAYSVLRAGYTIRYLFNTISREYSRVRFHGVEGTIIQQQADVLGMPLVQVPTSPDSYEREVVAALAKLVDDGVEGVVFGDIHLQHCLEWADKVCAMVGVRSIEPLWGLDPAEVLRQFVTAGFEAVVVSTQADLLVEEWCGRRVDAEFLDELSSMDGIDPCGENGEYHTLVTGGPIFKKVLQITRSRRVLRDGYWFLDIIEHRRVPAGGCGDHEGRAGALPSGMSASSQRVESAASVPEGSADA